MTVAAQDTTQLLPVHQSPAVASVALWQGAAPGSMAGRITLGKELARQIAMAYLNNEPVVLALEGSKVCSGASSSDSPKYRGTGRLA